METIVELVKYLNDENGCIFTMLDFDDSQVRITAIKLIKWLKMEHNRNIWVAQGKRNMHRPLVLDYKYDWCRDIKKLVTEDVIFSKIFSISDCKLDFNGNLGVEEKSKMLSYIAENLKTSIII